MKNLRKVLAMVLVIVMAFSLMTVASAKADFSDQASIAQKEAVDVMSALGIMVGSGGTGFDPAGTFTREQAAKVVALLLSPNAGKFKVSVSSFSDVAVTDWSSPFIEYCASKGIINGTGDGTFAPKAPVTGTSFAKMLLTALGYGKNNEYVGSNWEINVLDDALALKILSLDVNYSAAATREQVAQYAFNALFLPIQDYNKNFDRYEDTVVAPLTTAARLKLTAPAAPLNGASAYWYAINNVPVTGRYFTDNVIGTSFNGTAIADLMDVTKTTFIGAPNSPTYVVNGKTAAAIGAAGTAYALLDPVIDGGVLKVCTTAGVVGGAVAFTAYSTEQKVGDTIVLMDNTVDGVKNVDKIAITIKSVAVVGATGVTVTPQINGQPDVVSVSLTAGGPIAGTALTVSGYTGLVKDDVILYYKNAAGVTVIEKATANTGKINGYTGTTAITINGAAYVRSAQTGSMTVANMVLLGYNKDITYYTDSNGLVVYAAGPYVAPVVANVVVLGAALVPGNGWTPAHVEAKLLFPDGTTKVVTLADVDNIIGDAEIVNDTPADLYAEVDTAGELNIFYAYTVDAYGYYTLTTVATGGAIVVSSQTTTDIYKNTPDWCEDGTSIGNAASIFLVRTGTAPNYVYTAYVGIANLPAMTDAATVQIIDTSSRTTIAYIMDPAAQPASTNTAFFYNLDATYFGETAPGAGDAYYLYTALVNGVATPVKTAAAVAAKGLYSVTYNANNVVTAKTEVGTVAGATVAGTDTTAAAGGIVGLGASFYTYSDTAVVYIANADGTVTTTTIGAVTTDAGDNDLFYAYLTAGAVTTLYIVVVA
jgi:hypothetical protein